MQTDGYEIPGEGEWTFASANAAANFSTHVRQQLPFYDLVTRAIGHIARHYIPQQGRVYDIGASDGNIGRELTATLETREAELIGVEPSADMRKVYRAPGKLIGVSAADLAVKPFDLAIANLVFMFMEPAEVPLVVDRLIGAAKPGGAIVVVDKTTPAVGYPGIVLQRLAWAEKLRAGVRGDAIVGKDLALAGIQRPIPAGLFHGRGFVEWFRFGDFAGWLYEKEGN